MPRKKTKKAGHEVIVAPAPIVEPATPATKATEEPAPEPKAAFQQLQCTSERPEGFYGGRFVRNDWGPTVVAGRPFMRRR